MYSRPDLPKRLAARIRGAQSKVRNAAEDIASDRFNLKQSKARLAEYDADPQKFADKYYPRQGVDSYPVQTTISRERERYAQLADRQEARRQRLTDAEANLVVVEAEVCEQILAMRETAGRMPWPALCPVRKISCATTLRGFMSLPNSGDWSASAKMLSGRSIAGRTRSGDSLYGTCKTRRCSLNSMQCHRVSGTNGGAPCRTSPTLSGKGASACTTSENIFSLAVGW